ncbi:ras-related and estrogen-regulated growth inhibitor-like protein isoform X1 [Excalfactoria chinensis]|uniref:ras-related and estrogen-regulated growth inhibitor-like protein isoform X1 n=1 Tax=Excalfactoria chinensis TaxID=46218 RepID=UPI003B3B9391
MRLRLRRSASFTPEHPALLELPCPTALRTEANVLVMGADSVGKSALTVRFLTRRFIGEYGDMEFIYSHTLTVDGREVLFHIWDVPNSQDQADDGSSEEKRIQWADSFVLVYSICDRASFDLLPLKVQFIRAAKEGQGQVPIVIVGNKRDLQHQRAVSSEEGRLLALSLDCGFYEVSAAEAYHGALMVFHGLAERIPDTSWMRPPVFCAVWVHSRSTARSSNPRIWVSGCIWPARQGPSSAQPSALLLAAPFPAPSAG